MKRIVFEIVLTLLLTSMLPLMANIKQVKSTWTGTVYIRADGSIYPPDAPIVTFDNMTYTLTGNITSSGDGIVIERSNILIDGAKYALQGNRKGCGVYWIGVNNVTLKDLYIENFAFGAYLDATSQCVIYRNTLTNNVYYGLGIRLSSDVIVFNNSLSGNVNYGISVWNNSHDIILKGNKVSASELAGIYISNSYSIAISMNDISENVDGVFVYNATNNMIIGNNITQNRHSGLEISLTSSGNKIYHNNFINNAIQVSVFYYVGGNVWDDGYPSGGNYWSDYTGVDEKSGPNQDQSGSDGIGDTPYIIDENNVDRYPLMKPHAPKPTVKINPSTLNLRSKDKWITAYIELPENYNVANINVSTIMLNETILVEPKPVTIGDYDADGIPDLMVKFDMQKVINYILNNVNLKELLEKSFMTITLTVSGHLNDGTPFQGADVIRIRYSPRFKPGIWMFAY